MTQTILSIIFLAVTAQASGQDKAELVASRLIQDSSFEIVRSEARAQPFPARPSDVKEIHITEDGVYTIGYNSHTYPKETAYSAFSFEKTLKCRLPKGTYTMPKKIRNSAYFGFIDKDGLQDDRVTVSVFEHGYMEYKYGINPGAAFKKHSYIEWHYADGATLAGLRQYAEASGNKEILRHIEKVVEFNMDNMPLFRSQYDSGATRTQNYRLFRSAMLDDTGGPALPYVEAALSGDEKLRLLSDAIADYIHKEQYRLPDGSWVRAEPKWTVWCDDMFMGGAFLARYYDLTGDTAHLKEAAAQAMRYRDHLFDEETGLMYHAWNDTEGRHLGAHWGRANGWYLWAVSDILLRMDESTPEFSSLLEIHNRLLKSIVGYQSGSGLWHQVLDHPETYEESSASCAFVFALARAVRKGWLPQEYRQYAVKGWKAIEGHISDDGRLSGICRSMSVQDSIEGYNSRETADNDPRGLGLFFMAAAEMKLLNQ